MKTGIGIGLLLLTAYFSAAQLPEPAPVDYEKVKNMSTLRPGEDIDEKIKRNFFLRTDLSDDECYVGECLMAVYKAYSRLDANSQVVMRPSLDGFSVIEMVDAYHHQPGVEQFEGEYYFTHLIRKVQLFPLKAGKMILEPAEVDSRIELKSVRDDAVRNRRFRNFFHRGIIARDVNFRSPEVIVDVKPLPTTNQPQDFQGAVGKFDISVEKDENDSRNLQEQKIRLVISGSGNFPFITEPPIDWPEGLIITGPLVSEQVDKSVFPLSGKKVFTFSVQSNMKADWSVPPIRFSFFNPADEQYHTVSTDSFIITTAGSPPAAGITRFDTPVNTGNSWLPYFFVGGLALFIAAVLFFLIRKNAASRK